MVQYSVTLVVIFAFVGHALSVQLQAQPHDPPAPERTVTNWLSDPPKVFFFAGIEGSGTKIFQELWFNAFNDSNFVDSDDQRHHVLHFPDEWQCGVEWDPDGKQKMVAKMQALEKDSVWALPYQATYPSCGAHEHLHEDRAKKFHPHLEWIRDAAKEAGVKLHVIMLQRSFQETLALDCVKRDYENCQNQSSTMQQNAKELQTQVENLDNEVVSCFKHYDEDKMLQDVRTNFALSPETQSKMKTLIDSRRVTKKSDGRTLSNMAPLLDAGPFNEAGASLHQVCSTLSQFTMKDFADILKKATELNDLKKK